MSTDLDKEYQSLIMIIFFKVYFTLFLLFKDNHLHTIIDSPKRKYCTNLQNFQFTMNICNGVN